MTDDHKPYPKPMTFTETVLYQHGTYARNGNRIFLNKDVPPPVGFKIKLETKRIEPQSFINIFGESHDGVSYEVEGWGTEVRALTKERGE